MADGAGTKAPAMLRRLVPRRYVFGGLCGALVCLWLSLTPSLLPRGWLFQGVVSGASVAIGYGLGVLLSAVLRRVIAKESSPALKRWAWRTLVVVALIGTTAMLAWFGSWQRELRELMGTASFPGYGYVLVPVSALVFAVLFIAIGRAMRRVTAMVTAMLNRIVPPAVSAVVAVLLVIGVTIGILNGVVVRATMSGLNESFAAINDETDPETAQPTSPLRSGSRESVVTWASLGKQGRSFVSSGPSAQQLRAFNNASPQEPIRAYAGLASAGGYGAEADLVVDDLERSGAFERAVIAVGTTTGTGWVNESTVSALEYMYNGDTAVASMQYSYLPSPISFLVDKERARAAGQALFEAVYARWHVLPEDSRPKLVVFGESLGSFGAEAPFTSIEDLAARADGALFIGPTYTNEVWQKTSAERAPGSPQWLPIYKDGSTARFIAGADDLSRPDTEWPSPRVVYLQYPSDPITWWSPHLPFRKPDWLRESRGRDVLDSVQWIPVITFLQVSADMAVSNDVPDGHGHTFHADIADSWAAILQPTQWSADQTLRLRELLRQNAGE